jgi:hypothetical protein
MQLDLCILTLSDQFILNISLSNEVWNIFFEGGTRLTTKRYVKSTDCFHIVQATKEQDCH